jgi:ribosomal protein L12E/L44/L45/RPP1/RPP2
VSSTGSEGGADGPVGGGRRVLFTMEKRTWEARDLRGKNKAYTTTTQNGLTLAVHKRNGRAILVHRTTYRAVVHSRTSTSVRIHAAMHMVAMARLSEQLGIAEKGHAESVSKMMIAYFTTFPPEKVELAIAALNAAAKDAAAKELEAAVAAAAAAAAAGAGADGDDDKDDDFEDDEDDDCDDWENYKEWDDDDDDCDDDECTFNEQIN